MHERLRGVAGGLLVGIFANSAMAETVLAGTISGGGLNLLKWQALTALWVIVFSAIGTFILLKLVGLFVPLRMTEAEMEVGDIAVHGHEVYPPTFPLWDIRTACPRPPDRRHPCAGRSGRLDRSLHSQATKPPPSPWGAVSRLDLRGLRAGGRASSPAPGVAAAAREVATNTRRTGLAGCSCRTWMSGRTVDRASSGIRATPTPAATSPCTVRRRRRDG